jgi:hypothetical protein
MASNGRNEVSLRKCVLYHSASRRTRRSNNRYPHVSTPLAPITMIRIASLRLCESEQLCELGVEHPRRKESGQSPVLETLRNDRVA